MKEELRGGDSEGWERGEGAEGAEPLDFTF